MPHRSSAVAVALQIAFVGAFLIFVWLVAADGAATVDRLVSIDGSAVAWYGAVVATLSLLLHAWNQWQERAHLLIRVQTNMQVHAPGTPRHGQVLTLLNVVNTGRRPTTVNAVGFRSRAAPPGANYALLADGMSKCPVEVTEGRAVQFELDQADVDPADIEYFVVFDVAGRRWTRPVEPAMWDIEA